MKKLYYLISALGFAAIVLAYLSIDSGTSLTYAAPQAIIGTVLLCYGISGAIGQCNAQK